MLPRCSRTTAATRLSPSPLPTCSRSRSSRTNGCRMRCRSAAGMPGPLSATCSTIGIRLGRDAHVDASAGRHIFDGVLDQVHERLREQLAVAASRRSLSAAVFERDLAGCRFRPIQLDQLARQRGEIHCLGRDIAAAALGLCDLQQRAERSLHAFELGERRLHRPARVLAQAFVLQRLFDAHSRAIQRTAQIVRGAVERRAQHVGLQLDAFRACD